MRTAKLVNITRYKADSFYGTRISGTDLLLAPPPHCQQLHLNLRNLLMYRSQPRALDDSTSFGRSPPRMDTGSCVSSGARRDKHKSMTVHANARAALRLSPHLTARPLRPLPQRPGVATAAACPHATHSTLGQEQLAHPQHLPVRCVAAPCHNSNARTSPSKGRNAQLKAAHTQHTRLELTDNVQ